jgi:hypothetical protein
MLIIFLVGFSSCSRSKKNNKKKLKYKGIAKVFNVKKEATKYTLTIFVDQPGAGGDRETFEWVGWMNIDPGHAFVRLERDNADGTKSTVTVGFYADGSTPPHPSSPVAKGVIRDDTGHIFEVRKEYIVSEENFYKSLKYIEAIESSKKKYNLNTYNCADFAIRTVKAAGETVPDTQGTWTYTSKNGLVKSFAGGGSNPGDLGEDLR